MKARSTTNRKRLEPRFGPDIRFALEPRLNAEERERENAEFTRLRERLLTALLAQTPDNTFRRDYIENAISEAEALAWATAHPLLVFPTLAEEKATEAALRADRQQVIRRKTEGFLRRAA
jgi:hypothetical protein